MINVDFYSLIAFLIVICTFGMETAYFRYSEQEGFEEPKVFGAAATMILIALIGISAFIFFGQGSLLEIMRYENTALPVLPNRDFRVGCPQRHTLCQITPRE